MPQFFQLSSWALGLILFAVVLGTTGLGLLLGRSQRHRSDSLREPLAVLQAALLGVVGLILAFGLALAVGRYEARRGAVVEEANAIGTTYLRAQTLAEPIRTGSLQRLVRYTDTSIALSQSVPGSPAARRPGRPPPMASSCSASCGPWPDRPWRPRPSPAPRDCTWRASTR